MTHNFENNNSRKKVAEKKSTNNFKPQVRLKDRGFVAWPGNKLSTTRSADIEILEVRTRDGGYIAYPKK